MTQECEKELEEALSIIQLLFYPANVGRAPLDHLRPAADFLRKHGRRVPGVDNA